VYPFSLPTPRPLFFEDTRHNLSGLFLEYWQRHGDTGQLGEPISEPFTEVSRTDGKSYRVQYFASSRLEYHPELPPAWQVSRGLIGVEVIQARGWLP